MNFREHRGLLAESMETAAVLAPTLAAIRDRLSHHGALVDLASLAVGDDLGPDPRIGWPATIVIRDRHGVVGFTDQMPT